MTGYLIINFLSQDLLMFGIQKNYLNGLPTNFNFPIKLLSQKPAPLLALIAAARSSGICYLDTDFIAKLDNKYIFISDKLPGKKIWRRGGPFSMVEFNAYPQNPNLCVVDAISSYLQSTQCFMYSVRGMQIIRSRLLDGMKKLKKLQWLIGLKQFHGQQE